VTVDRPENQDELTRRTREAYDRLAAVWSSTTDEGPWNGVLERPALRALVPGNLHGARVLEAGCGSGAQAEWLLERGADIVAVDVSPRMIEEAKRRCAGRGRFLLADLARPLPLEPRSLDGITCSLALHHIADWTVPLRSFASALRPGGWAVISLDHPFAGMTHLPPSDTSAAAASRRAGHRVQPSGESATMLAPRHRAASPRRGKLHEC
jgi:SAM-dependent methyltransferase